MTAEHVAFVAGATGFVGRAVVERLRGRARVIAHVRPESKRLAQWRERLAAQGGEVDASPWQLEALTEALRRHRPTHLFGLLGTTRKQAKAEGITGDPYEAIDYGLTKLLIDAAVAAGGAPRFTVLSSIGVGPRSGGYLGAHWKAEEALRASGLPWLVARPSFIAPGGDGARRDDSRPGEKVAAVIADGALRVAGLLSRRTRDRYASTTPERLADALVRHALDGPPDRILEGADLR